MTDTDADLIAKAKALIARLDDGTTRTKNQRRAIALNALRSLCEPDEREQEPSKAMRLLDHVCAVISGHGVIMTRDQIDAATAIIEAALAGAEERGEQREREACAGRLVELTKACAQIAEDYAQADIFEDTRGFVKATAKHIAAAILARGGL